VFVSFSTKGWRDFETWLERDPAAARKVHALITEASRTPREGRGHPERLKHHANADVWSRRIAREHRLVYVVFDDEIVIASLRGHYATDIIFEKRT
jgi:toxin YoeB